MSAALDAWRTLPEAEQLAALAAGVVPDRASSLGRPRRPRADPTFLDLVRADADTCPFGRGPCGCGAEPRTCTRPDRPDHVFRRDCLRCVARDRWEAQPM